MRKGLLGGVASVLLPLCSTATGIAGSYTYLRSYQHNRASQSHLENRTHPGKNNFTFSREQDTPKITDPGKLSLLQGKVTRELVIIDEAVPDKHLFYLKSRPEIEVIEISSKFDGAKQLKSTLANYRNLDALHIVSHAEDGVILLGNSKLTEESLRQDITAISGIEKALKKNGDLLLYGCNLAESKKGESLISLIAASADVDVAASNDASGNTQQNADWDLEIKVGTIETDKPFSDIALLDFSSTLASATYTSTEFCNSYSGCSAPVLSSTDGKIEISTDNSLLTTVNNGLIYSSGAINPQYGSLNISADGNNLNAFSLVHLELTTAPAGYGYSSYCLYGEITGHPASGGAPVTYTIPTSPAITGTSYFSLPNIFETEKFSSFTISASDCDPGVKETIRISNFSIQYDSTAPVFLNSTPSVSNISTSSATLTVRMDEPGRFYYVILPENSAAPSPQQVINGQNSSGESVTFYGNVAVTAANQDFTVGNGINGLHDTNTYDIFVVAEDTESNLQPVATKVTFSTNPKDYDSTLEQADGVTEPVRLGMSSLASGVPVELFDFTINDLATSDGLPTAVSIVVKVSGTSSQEERENIHWHLRGSDGTDSPGNYSRINGIIEFGRLSVNIPDGNSHTYTLSGSFSDLSGVNHGNTLQFDVDDSSIAAVLTESSVIGAGQLVTNGSGSIITDDIIPTITSVTLPADGEYNSGDHLDFIVNYDEELLIDTSAGTPRLVLTLGTATRYVSYVSGTSSLSFRYTVQPGDMAPGGISLDTALDLNFSTLKDQGGNDAGTSLGSTGSLTGVRIDTLSPIVTQISSVDDPTADSTPGYSFSSSEPGILYVDGSCGSTDEGNISSGTHSISLTQPDNITSLTDGLYNDCSIRVVDSAGNTSNILSINNFNVDLTSPEIDVLAGRSVNEGTSEAISNSQLRASDSLSSAENIIYSITIPPDNGKLLNAAITLNQGSNFTQSNIDNGDIVYEHNGGETSTDSFSFRVADQAGNVNTNGGSDFFFPLTILAENDAPITVTDNVTTQEDMSVPINVLANDSDPDDGIDPGSVTIARAPDKGSVQVNPNGSIIYSPEDNFNGSDSFSYRVNDLSGTSSPDTPVYIRVDPENDPPVANNDTATTRSGVEIAIDVADNDFDIDAQDSPDPSTLVIIDAPGNGEAQANSGTIQYIPADGFTGTDSFSYTIKDSTATVSNIAWVSVNVLSPNEVPVALDDVVKTTVNTMVKFAVLNNDYDLDGILQKDKIKLVIQPTHGQVIADFSTGLMEYTPEKDYVGIDTFTYTIEDDEGAISQPATVSVEIANTYQGMSLPLMRAVSISAMVGKE